MTRHRKTPADLLRDVRAQYVWGTCEHRALIQAGLRAPNMREFNLNDDYALTLCHPPSALPEFPKCAPPPVVWSGDNPFPLKPGLRMPGQGKGGNF